jgi:hypothetical protein
MKINNDKIQFRPGGKLVRINKLVSASAILFLSIFVADANAEYYVVCSAPATHYIQVNSRPACRAKRHSVRHVKHHRPHRHYHHYAKPRSHAEISIYYIYNAFPIPAACSCDTACTTCSPCSYCENNGYSSRSDVYYAPTSQAYMLDDYDNNDFDLDRRTADDVGSEMNIDY